MVDGGLEKVGRLVLQPPVIEDESRAKRDRLPQAARRVSKANQRVGVGVGRVPILRRPHLLVFQPPRGDSRTTFSAPPGRAAGPPAAVFPALGKRRSLGRQMLHAFRLCENGRIIWGRMIGRILSLMMLCILRFGEFAVPDPCPDLRRLASASPWAVMTPHP